MFQTGVIVVIDVVQPDDLFTAVKQCQGSGVADKSSGSGYKNFHDLSIPRINDSVKIKGKPKGIFDCGMDKRKYIMNQMAN